MIPNFGSYRLHAFGRILGTTGLLIDSVNLFSAAAILGNGYLVRFGDRQGSELAESDRFETITMATIGFAQVTLRTANTFTINLTTPAGAPGGDAAAGGAGLDFEFAVYRNGRLE